MDILWGKAPLLLLQCELLKGLEDGKQIRRRLWKYLITIKYLAQEDESSSHLLSCFMKYRYRWLREDLCAHRKRRNFPSDSDFWLEVKTSNIFTIILRNSLISLSEHPWASLAAFENIQQLLLQGFQLNVFSNCARDSICLGKRNERKMENVSSKSQLNELLSHQPESNLWNDRYKISFIFICRCSTGGCCLCCVDGTSPIYPTFFNHPIPYSYFYIPLCFLSKALLPSLSPYHQCSFRFKFLLAPHPFACSSSRELHSSFRSKFSLRRYVDRKIIDFLFTSLLFQYSISTAFSIFFLSCCCEWKLKNACQIMLLKRRLERLFSWIWNSEIFFALCTSKSPSMPSDITFIPHSSDKDLLLVFHFSLRHITHNRTKSWNM